MSASTKNLTEGEPWRLILFFTLPLIAGNIFQQLYAFVDTLIVGRILGVEALAAVGCTGPLLFLIMGFAMGTTSGLSIYTGQRFGAKDEKGVRQSAAACLLLTLAIAAVMTVLAYGLCRYLLIWMQTPPEIMDNAYAFISIIPAAHGDQYRKGPGGQPHAYGDPGFCPHLQYHPGACLHHGL